MQQKKAAFAVIAAGICWGAISLFIKPLSEAGMSALQVSAVRLLVSCVLYFAMLAIRSPQKLKIRLRDLWMFLCTGVFCVAMCNVLYSYTIIRSEASIAVVLMYTSPVFILLASAVFFKEKITAKKLVAMVMTVFGCVCVAGVLGSGYELPFVCLLTGLGSGLAYGMYTIFGRVALQKYDAETVTAYTFLIGAIALAPVGQLPATASLFVQQPQLLLWLGGLAIVSTVMAYGLYTWGLLRMEPGKAGILAAVEPLVGAVIGMTLFGESHDAVKLVGIVLILAAIVLMELPQKRGKYANS